MRNHRSQPFGYLGVPLRLLGEDRIRLEQVRAEITAKLISRSQLDATRPSEHLMTQYRRGLPPVYCPDFDHRRREPGSVAEIVRDWKRRQRKRRSNA